MIQRAQNDNGSATQIKTDKAEDAGIKVFWGQWILRFARDGMDIKRIKGITSYTQNDNGSATQIKTDKAEDAGIPG